MRKGIIFLSSSDLTKQADRFDPELPGVHTVDLKKGFISTNDVEGKITMMDTGGLNQMTVTSVSAFSVEHD